MADNIKVQYPYRGVRRSGYCFHPALDGLSDGEGVWQKAAERFLYLVNSFCDTAQLYADQQTLSEVVGGPNWKKDVMELFRAIEVEKDPYELEALAMVVFDVDKKTSQRELPYHSELKTWASELRYLDLGLTSEGGPVDPKQITRLGWTS